MVGVDKDINPKATGANQTPENPFYASSVSGSRPMATSAVNKPMIDRSKPSPLPMFNGKDFPVWKDKVLSYLKRVKLNHVITSNKPRHIRQGPDDAMATRDKEIQEFLDDDEFVRSIILFSLENDIARRVISMKTDRELWERLVQIQQDMASASKQMLQQEFCSMKMKRDGSIKD